MPSDQSYEAIINILRSLKSVKGVVIEVKSEIFGVAWAQSTDCPQPTYEGVIQSWKKKGLELYVKWPEYSQNKAVPLSALRNDTEGKSLELRLKNYEDGRPRPELYVPPPPKEGQTGPGDLESDEDEDESGDGGGGVLGSGDGGDDGSSDEDSDDEAANGSSSNSLPRKVIDEGQVWRRRHPHHVNIDSREAPRAKPSLNKGDIAINTISEMFTFLTPDDFWNIQLRHTNPKLLGTDRENAKLTLGELKRWWGYALALSLNPGVPIERAWSLTPLPQSVLPPMNLGRHGMSINRWKKVRSVLSFGPSDETSLQQDNWAFVRPMVDAFNTCRAEKFSPG